MLFFHLGVNQNVVDENHDKLIQVLHEHLIHEIHEIGRGIRKSEGHHGILVESIRVQNVVLEISDSRILSWWYSDLKSILEKILAPFI
jgi:hypothetical protein